MELACMNFDDDEELVVDPDRLLPFDTLELAECPLASELTAVRGNTASLPVGLDGEDPPDCA